jgi:hypothetical protein
MHPDIRTRIGQRSETVSVYREEDEIVMVPVPKGMLGAVYVALGNATAAQMAPGQVEETVEVRGQGSLTAAMVRRLESALDASALRSLITYLAEQSPDEVTFREAVQVAEVESNSLRAQLGSLSKLTKRLFEKAIWPMYVRYAEGGEASYSMDPKIAEWWLEAISRRQ